MSKEVNLEFLVKKAAKDLDLDYETLQYLAYNQYQYIRKFHQNPSSPRLSIFKLGSFEIKRNRFYNKVIKFMIPYIREMYTPETLAVLRKCISFRPILNYYYSLVPYKAKDYESGLYKKTKAKIGNIVNVGNATGQVSSKGLTTNSTEPSRDVTD